MHYAAGDIGKRIARLAVFAVLCSKLSAAGYYATFTIANAVRQRLAR
jgi:hypothetical protein